MVYCYPGRELRSWNNLTAPANRAFFGPPPPVHYRQVPAGIPWVHNQGWVRVYPKDDAI